MKQVTVKESLVQQAAEQGMDEFLQVFVDAIRASVGGEITAEALQQLNAHQATLLAYDVLRTEVMEGGFVQLIYNGYGGFIFHNPFGTMLRRWGIENLPTLMNKGRKLYDRYRAEIEIDCTDEEFMALFERFPAFDDLDDSFVENEEEWTAAIAYYVDEHLGEFAAVEP